MAAKRIVQIVAIADVNGNTQLHGLDENGGLWLFNGTGWEFLSDSPR